jgi:hypothetical protein
VAAGIVVFLYRHPPARQKAGQQVQKLAANARQWYREQFSPAAPGDGIPTAKLPDKTSAAKTGRKPATPTSPSAPAARQPSPPAKKAVAPSLATSPVTTLYRADEAFSSLHPVTIRLADRPADPAAYARLLLAELARDHGDGISPLPPGVTPQRIDFNDRTIIVDLPADAPAAFAGGGSNDEMLALYGMVNTLLKNMPAYDAVIFTVDGRRVSTLGGHLNLLEPLRFMPMQG